MPPSPTSTTFTYSNNTSSTSTDTILTSTSYTVPSGYSLTGVNVGTIVSSLGNNCFSGCSGLTTVTFDSVSSVSSLGNSCFQSCLGLTNITIPNSVTSLGNSCFQSCSGLTNITIPNSVTSLGTSCFRGCSGLTTLTISSNITSLSTDCFRGCTGLTTLTIPSNITSLGDTCFRSCTGLTTVTIGNSVTSLGNSCFFGCTGLITLTFGNSVTSLGDFCFQDCSGLTTVTFGNSVTSLGNSCFQGCFKLTIVTFGNSVTSLGISCFRNCSGLSNITYANPSIITPSAADIFAGTPVAHVNFYLTSSAPSPPIIPSGVYITSLYTANSSFSYFSSASCYNEGTLILVFKNDLEQFVKIEDLRPGDLVKTYLHGYKPIEFIGKNNIINNSDDPLNSMYKIDNLFVTGGHSLLIDKYIKSKYWEKEKLIDDKYCMLACEYDKAEQIKSNDIYTIYHLVLSGENERYGIYVENNILSESTSKSHFFEHKFILLE